MIDPFLAVTLPPARPARPTYPSRRLLIPCPDDPDSYIVELDYSSLDKLTQCWRQGENYLLRAREATRPTTATEFGGLFHTCLEYQLKQGQVTPEIRAHQLDLIREHYESFPVPPDEYRNAGYAAELLERYYQNYPSDGWEILSDDSGLLVERPYKIPFQTIEVKDRVFYPRVQLIAGEGQDPAANSFWIDKLHFVLTGRIDLVVSQGGMNWIVDHKTTSRGGTEFFDYFFLSLQTRGYDLAAKQITSLPIAGLLLNGAVCRKPTKTGIPYEFHRKLYTYSDDLIQDYLDSISSICSEFSHRLTTGFFPQNSKSFKSPCVGCDYHDNCRLDRHQRAMDLASDAYRDVTWNPMH